MESGVVSLVAGRHKKSLCFCSSFQFPRNSSGRKSSKSLCLDRVHGETEGFQFHLTPVTGMILGSISMASQNCWGHEAMWTYAPMSILCLSDLEVLKSLEIVSIAQTHPWCVRWSNSRPWQRRIKFDWKRNDFWPDLKGWNFKPLDTSYDVHK